MQTLLLHVHVGTIPPSHAQITFPSMEFKYQPKNVHLLCFHLEVTSGKLSVVAAMVLF